MASLNASFLPPLPGWRKAREPVKPERSWRGREEGWSWGQRLWGTVGTVHRALQRILFWERWEAIWCLKGNCASPYLHPYVVPSHSESRVAVWQFHALEIPGSHVRCSAMLHVRWPNEKGERPETTWGEQETQQSSASLPRGQLVNEARILDVPAPCTVVWGSCETSTWAPVNLME